LKRKDKLIVALFLALFLCGTITIFTMRNFSANQQPNTMFFPDYPVEELYSSSGDNSEILETIFTNKISEYATYEYFPQFYQPSLQATYYALYVLQSIGKLHEINQANIINYIMKHYDADHSKFMDILGYRYLDTDFDKTYFPLSTVLETTCYSVLSLKILDSLSLIDISDMIDFIWSCYNPVSGGFIGQPYNIGLEDGFKIATADNTYFAVITLDLIMEDWLGYSSQRTAIINFLNGLQVPSGNGWASGGFNNDEDGTFSSLTIHLEPNLISSYYSIKILEVFGMVSSINQATFHQFLTYLYDSSSECFRVSDLDYGFNLTNIVATSIGLELSNITGFTALDRTETLNFILDHRNSLGNWDQSTTVTLHELIDTYQIIRSFNDTNGIDTMTSEERNQIGNATLYYKTYEGFSPLSADYTSMNLIHTTIGAFDLYSQISEVDIQQLYNMIKQSYNPQPSLGIASRFFYGFLRDNSIVEWFRSHPIEYYTSGHKNYIHEISQINSHQSTFYALESLQKLFKLDDFASEYNLGYLASDIVDTQFLNTSYYNTFGAFSSILKYTPKMSETINNKIYCDYTYYAIRCLEILGNYLGLTFNQLGVDTTAVYTYIDRNMVETPTMVYFNPIYANDVETIMKTTYFMTYVLKSIDLYNKDSQKIKNYIESNLNYSNIENIYYSYKLSNLLDLNVEFDFHQIHGLVRDIFSEEFNEFYLTSDMKKLDQDIFLWICDMARTSQIGVEASYSDTCLLGGINHMDVSLYNLILQDFGSYITFKFESDQIGSYVFSKLANSTYAYDLSIPVDPQNYPSVEGYLRAYEGTQLKAELPISFLTNYTLEYNYTSSYNLESLLFEINASIIGNDKYPLNYGNAYVKVYKDNIFLRQVSAVPQIILNYSRFEITYIPQAIGEYMFELYLHDGISGSDIQIATIPYNINEILNRFGDAVNSAIPLTAIFIAVPGTVIVISTKKLKRKLPNS
jgi:prenyltransferase beta subunit